jgi:hypothetical protein
MPPAHSRNLLLGLKSLEVRRNILASLFMFDIINSTVNCPALLSVINFAVPSRHLRFCKNFVIKLAKSNYAANEPISRYLNLFNKLAIDHCIDFSINKSSFKSFLFNNL